MAIRVFCKICSWINILPSTCMLKWPQQSPYPFDFPIRFIVDPSNFSNTILEFPVNNPIGDWKLKNEHGNQLHTYKRHNIWASPQENLSSGFANRHAQQQSWNFGFRKIRYYTMLVASNKCTDQIARMCKLICAFVVRIWQKQVLSWRVSYKNLSWLSDGGHNILFEGYFSRLI